ncbi:MAG TPA: hypothetical protein VGE76_22095, partial [Opitutaceae bacterium]
MTTLGKVVVTLVILALAGFGAYKWMDRAQSGSQPAATSTSESKSAASAAAKDAAGKAAKLDASEFVAPLNACPLLPPAAAYLPKDN